jgi:hypothetical protein
MDENLGGLLMLGEVATLVESPPGTGRVHVEVGGAAQLHDETRGPCVRFVALPILQGDVLDVAERELDLVARRFVVDVIGHARLLAERIEDEQIHCVLADSAPGADAQRPTVKVLDGFEKHVSRGLGRRGAGGGGRD